MKLNATTIATVALATFLIPAIAVRAQNTATARPHVDAPKVELFFGYSYLRAVPTQEDGNRFVWLHGGSTSVAYNFNRYIGLVGDFGGFMDSELRLAGTGPVTDSSGSAYTYLGGPRLSFRNHGRFTPFAQALFGGVHASEVTLSSGCTGLGCTPLPSENSLAMTGGVGLDLRVHRHFAIRLVQADYMMTKFQNHDTGRDASQNDMRLSSGIVFGFGGNYTPPPPIALACSANPTSVFPGDPVIVTATASGLDPKLNVIYSVNGPGVSTSNAEATVATSILAPNSYSVNCDVKEGKPGREGLKPWESSSTTATFTVKPFEPPTISCSASPSDLKPSETSTVTAIGVSPQNRPLTYNYSATTGSISGSGVTASYVPGSATTGVVGIICSVTDDKNQTITANTSVTITVPPPSLPPAEQVRLETRLALHSVFFQTDMPRIGKPNGGLVISQEGTLTALGSDFKKYLEFKPDAHLTLTGHADLRGSIKYNQELSDRRVARTKEFLVEQGVPEAMIETRGLGKEENLTAGQVKAMVEQNPDLSVAEREKILHDLNVIVWAQNRRVDITLSTTGQQSVRQFPFSAADSLTLLDQRNLKSKKKTAAAKK